MLPVMQVILFGKWAPTRYMLARSRAVIESWSFSIVMTQMRTQGGLLISEEKEDLYCYGEETSLSCDSYRKTMNVVLPIAVII
jgi:hypothetical protein